MKIKKRYLKLFVFLGVVFAVAILICCILFNLTYNVYVSSYGMSSISEGCLSDVAVVDGKIYYSYYGNVFNSGVYEISDNNTKRILPAEVDFFPNVIVTVPPLITYHNKLIIDIPGNEHLLTYTENGTLKTFSDFNMELDTYSETMDGTGHFNSEINLFDDKLYLLSLEFDNTQSDDINRLYAYDDHSNQFNLLHDFKSEIVTYCIEKNDIYYVTKNDNEYHLYRVNKNNEPVFIKTLYYKNINSIYVFDKYVYVLSDKTNDVNSRNNFYIESINSDYRKLIFSGYQLYVQYDDGIFAFTDASEKSNGIYLYSLKTAVTEKISDYQASQVSICDNIIYFVSDHALYCYNCESKNTNMIFN